MWPIQFDIRFQLENLSTSTAGQFFYYPKRSWFKILREGIFRFWNFIKDEMYKKQKVGGRQKMENSDYYKK